MDVSEQNTKTASFKGMKNLYFCNTCGHGIVTLDVDSGVTPFIIGCERGCGGAALSFFYRCPQPMLANIQPVFEWYKPTPDEVATLSDAVRDHIARGGLIKRFAGKAVSP